MSRTEAVAVACAMLMAALGCGGGDSTGPSTERVLFARVSGDGQADTIGATLAEPLIVSVARASGDVIVDVEVRFEITAGEGSLSAATSRTDASGRASTTVTLGSVAGRVEVRATCATVTSSSVAFSATARPGELVSLQRVSGDGQLRFPGSTLVNPLVVRASDRAGNGVSAISVTWNSLAGGGSISPLSPSTNVLGEVSAVWTLGPQPGANTAEVTAASLDPLTFNARAAVAGPIAFSSDRASEEWDIFVTNADGSDVIQLTVDPAEEFDPAWSPDGTQVAFAREYGGSESNHWEIVVANADGSGETRITDTPLWDFNLFPAWSPDGQRIAFAAAGVGGAADVFLINPDGTGRVNITNNPENDQDPAWSPDGSRIVFMSTRDGDPEIYVMNADGTGQTRLTNRSRRDFRPDWSPDGAKILFQHFDGTCDGIWMMNPDGTGLEQLVACGAIPAWSPDGARFLASMLGTGDEIDVFAVDVQSGEAVNLTNHAAYDSWSAWRR
ncbi:MAG: PD40 domain-containing protein [Phycisphaerales bacterium]|nr:MAG: PD40 domain-containing protein [Phycisphaerales bacterium]